MFDKRCVLVPLESWAFASPDLIGTGHSIDIGLFTEALLYYDIVLINPANQLHLAEFINWFIRQGALEDLYALFMDGVLKIYDYSFITTVVNKDGEYSLWNIQDSIQKEENTFEQRFLYHPSIENLFPKSRHRKQLYQSFRENIIEVKADEFGHATENARADFLDTRRNTIVLQAFVDEIYNIKGLGRPPEIKSAIRNSSDGSKHHIDFNVNFTDLDAIIGGNSAFHGGTPLIASAHSNRLIWSASTIKADLFLPRPMSVLVGDKLFESKQRFDKSGNIIEGLKEKVEFPDVRTMVNSGKLQIKHILEIRKKSKKFRVWLQNETQRDRDAIIAYHQEVAKESGLISGARKALNLFGVISGATVGAFVGDSFAGPVGGTIAAIGGSAATYLCEVGARAGAEWKPVVFGNWAKERIEKIISEEDGA